MSILQTLFLVCAIVVLVIIISILWLFYRSRRRQQLLIQSIDNSLENDQSYEILTNARFEELKKKSNSTFVESFKSLSDHHYKALFLVHGTFVGDDPFHLAQLLSSAYPSMSPSINDKLKNFGKKTSDIFLGDFGNFSNEHLDLMYSYKSTLDLNLFNWSSGNNHLARIHGAMELIKTIGSRYNADDGVVLIGHSHAAQVFSLMTQLIGNKSFRKEVSKSFNEEINKEVQKMQKMKFFILTLGAPARYSWSISENIKLLHIINHKGETPLGGSLKSSLFTNNGDYIQQWGGNGSDINPSGKEFQTLNTELNKWLGDGIDREELKKTIKSKSRLHDIGHHILIDYGDSAYYPNFMTTGFGHGVYTKKIYLEFYLNLISQNL